MAPLESENTALLQATKPKCYSYIRFSTPDQLKGDSLRRQLELADTYAKKKGLILDETLKMQDLGLSAYKGEHRTKGALGTFLEMVGKNLIPVGSHLVIEELDRLTRQAILEAVNLFTGILLKDITLHTAADEMTYTKDDFDMGQLIISAYKLSAGHEESLKKSKRLGKAWENKRNNIGQKKLTGKCPAWIELNKDNNSFNVITERSETVKQIFIMAQSGQGAESIAKTLNNKNNWIPNNEKRKSYGWRKSYVVKILHSRAVIGEYQPHTGGGLNRKPVGEPIKNYYPAIISEELFYSVQRTGEQRPGGRNGNISNLFGTLAKCGYCGASMRFINKGKPPRGGTYLVCDNAERGLGCKKDRWRYSEIEELILSYCKGLDVSDLTENASSQEFELNSLLAKLAAITEKEKINNERIDNLTDQLADTARKDTRALLEKKLNKLQDENNIFAEAKNTLEQSIIKLNSAQQNTAEHIANLKELMLFMKTETGEKRIEVRRKLRHKLRCLIEDIKVYPVGNMLGQEDFKNKSRRELTINFKNGCYRVIAPNTPTKLTVAYEREEGRTYYPFVDSSGKTDVDIDIDETEEEREESSADYNAFRIRLRNSRLNSAQR